MKQLIGKTIKNIETIGDYDYYGDGESASEVIKVTCTDGTEVYLIGDGGDGAFYCTIADVGFNNQTGKLTQGGVDFGDWLI
jgi:hypothetical protein